MTSRTLAIGLAVMAAIFLVGAVIGGVWDRSDAAGAVTVAMWAVAIIGALVLLAAFLLGRRREAR